MEDYKKQYQVLSRAVSKAVEALQNALMDIENMSLDAKDELLPGFCEVPGVGVAYAEETNV